MEIQKKRQKRNWHEIITNWENSGKSVKDFCDEAGLYKSDFYRMRKKLNADEPGMVKIPAKEIAAGMAEKPMILEICRKYRIEIRKGFSPETLKTLLAILESF
jgi:hypothetical protein